MCSQPSIFMGGFFYTVKSFPVQGIGSKCRRHCESIANEILMNIRTTKKYANDLYLQDTIGVDGDGNEVKIEDKIADEDYCIEEEVELKMKIAVLYEKIKKVLKGRERTVIELRYGLVNGNELTQREIAELLDISRSYVSGIFYCK